MALFILSNHWLAYELSQYSYGRHLHHINYQHMGYHTDWTTKIFIISKNSRCCNPLRNSIEKCSTVDPLQAWWTAATHLGENSYTLLIWNSIHILVHWHTCVGSSGGSGTPKLQVLLRMLGARSFVRHCLQDLSFFFANSLWCLCAFQINTLHETIIHPKFTITRAHDSFYCSQPRK